MDDVGDDNIGEDDVVKGCANNDSDAGNNTHVANAMGITATAPISAEKTAAKDRALRLNHVGQFLGPVGWWYPEMCVLRNYDALVGNMH